MSNYIARFRKRDGSRLLHAKPCPPPVSEAEILAVCRRFLDAYGSRAAQEARARRDRLLADDDIEGFQIWSRILARIGHLNGEGGGLSTYN